MAIVLVFEGSNVRSRTKSIILSSKKHHVVGQLVLENRATTLINRAKVINGVVRVVRGRRKRGMWVSVWIRRVLNPRGGGGSV